MYLWPLLMLSPAAAFAPAATPSHAPPLRRRAATSSRLAAQKAGSFFNAVPSGGDGREKDGVDEELARLLQDRQRRPRAAEPSTINGVPTAASGTGFGRKPAAKPTATPKKPYVAIGARPAVVNDPTRPEYDDQGYTLYQDETTGEKARVFEALVEYPTLFTMKIVGLNEGLFVEEMVAIVAESCQVADAADIEHSVKVNGKWSSITVNAPVQSAEMLYALYENVDRDPRVKFKF